METHCYWYEDGDGSAVWSTGCGRHWYFTEGSPQDNGIKFCFGCGKPVDYAKPMKFLGEMKTDDGDTYEVFQGHTRSDVGVTAQEMQSIIMAVVAQVTRSRWPFREQLEPGSAHLTVSGRFQSDKYPWCAAGYVPISTTDPMAQDLLRKYAKRRAAVDKDFCADLLAALPHDEPA